MSGAGHHHPHANWGYGPGPGAPCYFTFGSSSPFQVPMPGAYVVHPQPAQAIAQGQAFFCSTGGGGVDANAYARQVPYAQHMAATHQALGLAGPHSNLHAVSVPPAGGGGGFAFYGAYPGPGPGAFLSVPAGYYWPGPQLPNKTPVDGGAVWSPHAPMPVDRYYAQGGRGSA